MPAEHPIRIEAREEKHKQYIAKNVKNWQRRSFIPLGFLIVIVIGLVTYSIVYQDLSIYFRKEYLGEFGFWTVTFILSAITGMFVFRPIYDRYQNHANIENYKKTIE